MGATLGCAAEAPGTACAGRVGGGRRVSSGWHWCVRAVSLAHLRQSVHLRRPPIRRLAAAVRTAVAVDQPCRRGVAADGTVVLRASTHTGGSRAAANLYRTHCRAYPPALAAGLHPL